MGPAPDPGEVHVWAFVLEDPCARVPAWEALLAPDELTRAERYRFDRDRNRFIAGRAAVRRVLATYTGAPPGALALRSGPAGRPSLAAAAGECGLDFSVAHSQALLAVALARGRRVGIDVEHVGRRGVDADLRELVSSAREAEWLAGVDAHDRPRVFLRLWTRKEALLKGDGRGLSFPPKELDVSATLSGTPVGLHFHDPRLSPSSWSVWDADLAPDYVGTVVAAGAGCHLRTFAGGLLGHPG